MNCRPVALIHENPIENINSNYINCLPINIRYLYIYFCCSQCDFFVLWGHNIVSFHSCYYTGCFIVARLFPSSVTFKRYLSFVQRSWELVDERFMIYWLSLTFLSAVTWNTDGSNDRRFELFFCEIVFDLQYSVFLNLELWEFSSTYFSF